MFYDIVIHPSRIELVHRFFSPEKNVIESKKIGYKDLDFKFGVKTVEDGENFGAVKETIDDLLSPYKGGFNCINIIPPVTFFQFKEFPCSEENSDFPEYVLWEAFQMATDVPEHYKFGFIYEKKVNSVYISLVRKKVYYYFRNLLHELFPEGIEMKLLSAYRSVSDSDHFIEISKDLTAPFADNASKETAVAPVSIEDEPRRKKSLMPAFAVIIILLLSTAALYILKPGLFDTILKSETAVAESTMPETAAEDLPLEISEDEFAEDAETEIDLLEETAAVTEDVAEEVIKTTPETVVAAETPDFWDYIKALTESEADSVVFVNSTEIGVYSSDDKVLQTVENYYKNGSFSYERSGDKLSVRDSSFVFENSRLMSNFRRFVSTKDMHDINPIRYYEHIFRIEPLSKFFDLIDDLEKNDVGFKKFVIEIKNNYVIFTVYFG